MESHCFCLSLFGFYRHRLQFFLYWLSIKGLFSQLYSLLSSQYSPICHGRREPSPQPCKSSTVIIRICICEKRPSCATETCRRPKQAPHKPSMLSILTVSTFLGRSTTYAALSFFIDLFSFSPSKGRFALVGRSCMFIILCSTSDFAFLRRCSHLPFSGCSVEAVATRDRQPSFR